jgi:hypothetical protein
LECDKDITVKKPDSDQYLALVSKTEYNAHPFFQQLKDYEDIDPQKKEAKKKVVENSIQAYLETYGTQMNVSAFAERVQATQTDKHYVLWQNGSFTIDCLLPEEMTQMAIHPTSPIKNGKYIVVQAGSTTYELLLRWRNHMGILNPAWQITMKRPKEPKDPKPKDPKPKESKVNRQDIV